MPNSEISLWVIRHPASAGSEACFVGKPKISLFLYEINNLK